MRFTVPYNLVYPAKFKCRQPCSDYSDISTAVVLNARADDKTLHNCFVSTQTESIRIYIQFLNSHNLKSDYVII